MSQSLPTKRPLSIIMIVVVFFVFQALCGLHLVAKGAYFNQLNALHLKYNHALVYALAQDPNKHYSYPFYNDILTNILEQPLECLRIINRVDRALMRVIDTTHAITLCEQDAALAADMIERLNQAEQGQLSRASVLAELTLAADVFLKNSSEFEQPIEKTVTVARVSATLATALLGLLITILVWVQGRTINRSVSALQSSEQSNRLLAEYDSLTGLANRNQFNQRLSTALGEVDEHNSVGVLFIDLDGFKHVNDTHGHQLGDKLLCVIAERLHRCVRKNDLIARLGGDEFVVMLELASEHRGPSAVARKIIECVRRPIEIDKQHMNVTASIGIATAPSDGADMDTLLKKADVAMYQAKEKGKNTFEFYSIELHQEEQARLQYERELRLALANNEFSLQFQPVVDLRRLCTVSAEALLRWKHPEKGWVSPATFIPIAEESGDIRDIGLWVIEEACRWCKHWRNQGHRKMRVAVNVSVEQLKYSDFVDELLARIQASDLPLDAIELELTESVFLEQNSQCLDTLTELGKKGLRLMIDDFGTGYSCFSYLSTANFNVLKIDRSFVQSMNACEEHGALVSSIVHMCKALKIPSLAEGIESEAELDTLTKLGCEFGQGFWFSKPVDPEMLDPSRCFKLESRVPNQSISMANKTA